MESKRAPRPDENSKNSETLDSVSPIGYRNLSSINVNSINVNNINVNKKRKILQDVSAKNKMKIGNACQLDPLL